MGKEGEEEEEEEGKGGVPHRERASSLCALCGGGGREGSVEGTGFLLRTLKGRASPKGDDAAGFFPCLCVSPTPDSTHTTQRHTGHANGDA
jgi:hypothetical protein